ncbi:neutral/alkaline non-lysosomal ceramidase N-terminal domain-containing protein [Nocardia alni]|uniref:neutral/alkaline non-lysosomal ceramidase N-terminal domain-containing protein n=1 Tax=Nocardia alni TaxID=2815723 RepID=UPI001C21C506|nr:neutral/alkaline non-lysosomal ceramidase N-terminal domain-containing protein [Nocardia alni]
MTVSRRSVLAGGAAVAAVGATGLVGTNAAAARSLRHDDRGDAQGYLIGCGIGDITGAPAGQGMMGYSEADQVATGLLMRCRARAYIIVDQATGSRVAFVNTDNACLFQSVYLEALQRLAPRFGTLYTEHNVNINATHNHNSCGGTAREYAYSAAAYGFQLNSFEAEVSGIVSAVVQAHERLAPGTLLLGHGELHNAGANRSRVAFELDPPEDKAQFPDAIDPMMTVLRLRQGNRDVGAIAWFATHGTSLTDHNTLISADNKGYASYRWEHDEMGVRYLDGSPGFVAAFPQTNAGDITPNLNLIKFHPTGPTENNRDNCAIIGERQYQAGRAAFASARPMSRGGVDSVARYVNMADVAIDGSYTPDGKPARTSPAMMGAGAVATSEEDNWNSQLPFLREGDVDPIVAALGGVHAPIEQWMRDVQAPKLILLPLGIMPPRPWNPQVLMIQIMRIGDLVLASGPAEFTIVAGLRVRQIVAHDLGVPLEHVLLQGYANGYSQYVTTPEEYVSQQYEGGETQFGRWTLSAYMQEFDRLARAMAARVDLGRGPAPLDWTVGPQPDLLPPVPPDAPVAGRTFGDVLIQPPNGSAGRTIAVEFCGAHPNNDFHANGTYYEVQRADGSAWQRVADDNDWVTEMHWRRPDGQPAASIIRIQWTVPPSAEPGRYRFRYNGDIRDATGKLTHLTATSAEFTIS